MAATVLAAGIALSGCAGQPGAAAIIDGQTISEQSLSRSGAALQPFLQDQLTPRAMLSSMIQAEIFLQVASDHGLGASAEEARDYLDNIAEEADIDAPENYPDGTIEVARMLMINQNLQTSDQSDAVQQEVVNEIDNLDVSINPRYGSWDPQAMSGSLIQEQSQQWLLASDEDDAAGPAGPEGPGAGDPGATG